MVKEHFIKEYGIPEHTIGLGGSAGAYEQYLIAQNYPGLLDGIVSTFSFPDFFSSVQSVTDCALLARFFEQSSLHWRERQKTAVSGFASWQTCQSGWSDGNGRIWPVVDPRRNCPPLIPKDTVYDRTSNPRGVRCDMYTNEINVLGSDPRTGLVNRPLDNVGVQYGLVPFNKGQIDAEQFVELNEHIGGFDRDGGYIRTRTEADMHSVVLAYRSGILLTGGGGLGDVPIIDERPYDDDEANQHDRLRSLVIRARLAATGHADNQVILTYPRQSEMDLLRILSSSQPQAVQPNVMLSLVHQMNHWLDAVTADQNNGTLAMKVRRDKPADLADTCWATDGEQIVEPARFTDGGRCNQLYPPHADPRIAAGGPLTDDILKCALKPVRAADYARPLTPDQIARLKNVFPNGVCDYGRPGLGQEVTRSIWQRF